MTIIGSPLMVKENDKWIVVAETITQYGCNAVEKYPRISYKAPFKNMPLLPQPTQTAYSQACETGATFGSADSYCNICQKYFCNKYFLKKHRQNIHGIYEDPNLNNSGIHVPVTSSPLPLIRASLESKSLENSLGLSTKDETSKLNVSLENIKNSLNLSASLMNGSSPLALLQNKKPIQSIIPKEKKIEKFLCELCNIEFCDKHFLDAHKANKHGQAKPAESNFADFSEVGKLEIVEKSSDDSDDSKDNFKGQMCAPCMKNFTTSESFKQHMLDVHGASFKDDEDARSSDFMVKKNGEIKMENNLSPNSVELENSNGSTESSPLFNCSICFMKCKDRRSFILHLESEHNVLSTIAVVDKPDISTVDSLTCDLCPEQFQEHVSLMSHKFKIHGVIPKGLEVFTDGIENGDYSFYSGGRKSSGSSFCQICNKDLCNKYFLKTHMLKMHGIDVDKGQLDKSPITTTGGGVFCDICQKFLCSKYFLKVHKQNVHGILDDSPTPKVSLATSPLSNLLNDKKSEKHLLPKLNSDGFSNGDEASKNSCFVCEICGQEFTDKILLQFHLVNKHVKATDAFSFVKSLDFQSNLADDSKDAIKAGVLPCSCCSFVNLDDSTKLSHMDSEMQMISCTICNVTYSQIDFHTHHLSHGISLPISKHNLENGVHELGGGYDLSKNRDDLLQPRKLKRFRCSKCDKTFRTKLRCMQHIQVMHKSKKGSEQGSPLKKGSLNHLGIRKMGENKTNLQGLVNGTGLLDDPESPLNSGLSEGSQMPVPYKLPKNSDVIMQPFHLSEPKPEGVSKQNIFVPSLVYLPVSQKVSEPLTVAFTLTPA